MDFCKYPKSISTVIKLFYEVETINLMALKETSNGELGIIFKLGLTYG